MSLIRLIAVRRRMSNYNETCVFCGKKLDVYDKYIGNDYEDEFDMECPSCGCLLRVFAEKVIEFRIESQRECEA